VGEQDRERRRVLRARFGPHAAAYVTSAGHARGPSLARLLALTDPDPAWRMLDVATGAGHVALAFASRVRQVIGWDVTVDMLAAARELAGRRGLANVAWACGDAEALGFGAASFDLVTCRLAAHHFRQPGRFLAECARLLAPGGRLAVVDNVVPDSEPVARFMNAFERLRDPSHAACLSVARWQALVEGTGFAVEATEMLPKTMDFARWTDVQQVSGRTRERLRSMLVGAPREVRAVLKPEVDGARIRFQLSEAVLVARRR